MLNLGYSIENLRNIDWDFSSLGNEGLHSLHWYPATFISAIPGSIIPILTVPGSTILDTFCGTSVTGLEAIRLKRKFIGIDNNPVAILISKAKLLFPDTATLLNYFERFLQDNYFNKNHFVQHPNEQLLLKWYHPDTYQELYQILEFIKSIKNEIIKIPFQAIFSSILKKTSSQSRHWGWVCDNVVPKTGEITYKNAIEIYSKALKNYCISADDAFNEVKIRDPKITKTKLRGNWILKCGDTLSKMKSIENNKINLILTSPPYNGVADYIKSQRLTFLWFEKRIISLGKFSFSDFEALRKSEMGSRSHRYKQDSHSKYIQYMNDYLIECKRVLKSNGYLALIIGDSSARTDTITLIEQIAAKIGLQKIYNFNREIRQSKRRLMAKVKDEQIIIYKK